MTSREVGFLPQAISDQSPKTKKGVRSSDMMGGGNSSFKSMVDASESRHEESRRQSKTQESTHKTKSNHEPHKSQNISQNKSNNLTPARGTLSVERDAATVAVHIADEDPTLFDDALSVMEVIDEAADANSIAGDDVAAIEDLQDTDVFSLDEAGEGIEDELTYVTTDGDDTELGEAVVDVAMSVSDDEVATNIIGQQSKTDTVAHLTGESDATVNTVNAASKEETVSVEEVVEELVADVDDDSDIEAGDTSSIEMNTAHEELVVGVDTLEVAPTAMAAAMVVETAGKNTSEVKAGGGQSQAVASVAVDNVATTEMSDTGAQGEQNQSMMQQQAGQFVAEVTPGTIDNLALQGYTFVDEMHQAMQPTQGQVVLTSAVMTSEGDRVFTFDVQPDVSPDINTVHEQVRIAVSVARAEGHTAFQIQLAPEHLGLIEIQMEVVGDRVANIKMLCNRPETRDMLMKEAGMLIESVGKVMNAEDASLSFDLRSGEQNAQNFQQQNDGSFGDAEGADVAAPHASDSYEKGNGVSSSMDVMSDDTVDMKV